MHYKGIDEIPKEGQLCICRCPNWCEEGYQVAVFEDGEFQYDAQPNSWFHREVIAWLPLNSDGEPEYESLNYKDIIDKIKKYKKYEYERYHKAQVKEEKTLAHGGVLAYSRLLNEIKTMEDEN